MNPIQISSFIKNQHKTDITATSATRISFELLVNNLIHKRADIIVQNKICIENQVPYHLKIVVDQNKILPVINELLTTVLANARDTTILLTAEKYGGIVTLNIIDSNNFNGYALSFSLMLIGQQARFAGGDINIRGAQQRVATVSFSFPDKPVANHFIY